MSQRLVGMGRLAVSRDEHEVLVALALGSCIGLALLDRSQRRAAGLAHVMLPAARSSEAPPPDVARFADRAVPALADALIATGVQRDSLEAVIVGGARMFSFNSGELDIGPRNEHAVREALRLAGIPIRAADTGGSRALTMRLDRDAGSVAVQTIGEPARELYRSPPRTMTGTPA